jgi:hypothetical protein
MPRSEPEIRARARGIARQTLYREEFGVNPTPERCGDWASGAWREDWLKLQGDCKEDPDYDLCLAA